MIGDLILWIKDNWKQQFCLHDYKYTMWSKKCRKCGRIK